MATVFPLFIADAEGASADRPPAASGRVGSPVRPESLPREELMRRPGFAQVPANDSGTKITEKTGPRQKDSVFCVRSAFRRANRYSPPPEWLKLFDVCLLPAADCSARYSSP